MAAAKSADKVTQQDVQDVADEVGGAPDALNTLVYGTASTSEVAKAPGYVAQPEAGAALPDPDSVEAVDMGGTVRAQVVGYAFRVLDEDNRIHTAPRGRVIKATKDNVDRAVAQGILKRL